MVFSEQIKVFARIRPDENEGDTFRYDIIKRKDNKEVLEIYAKKPTNEYVNNKPLKHAYTFDKVFDQNVGQNEVFETAARPIINIIKKGISGTIFAYGQTGAGKTYTMTGTPSNWQFRGLIPRCLGSLILQESPLWHKVTVSYLEIYNNVGFDLLSNSCQRIALHEDASGVHLRHLHHVVVESEQEVIQLMMIGDKNRSVSCTRYSHMSSRSHCILTAHYESLDETGQKMHSTLHLVDLAGSERTGDCASFDMTETRYINKSLHFLEAVISALSSKGQYNHIPYRNCLMTTMLRDALGERCHITMIAMLSVKECNLNESLSTCRFAVGTSRITTRPARQELPRRNSYHQMRALQAEVIRLRNLLRVENEVKVRHKLTTQTCNDLTDEEKHICQEAVRQFLSQNSEESVIPFTDDRYIKECFKIIRRKLLKDTSNGILNDSVRNTGLPNGFLRHSDIVQSPKDPLTNTQNLTAKTPNDATARNLAKFGGVIPELRTHYPLPANDVPKINVESAILDIHPKLRVHDEVDSFVIKSREKSAMCSCSRSSIKLNTHANKDSSRWYSASRSVATNQAKVITFCDYIRDYSGNKMDQVNSRPNSAAIFSTNSTKLLKQNPRRKIKSSNVRRSNIKYRHQQKSIAAKEDAPHFHIDVTHLPTEVTKSESMRGKCHLNIKPSQSKKTSNSNDFLNSSQSYFPSNKVEQENIDPRIYWQNINPFIHNLTNYFPYSNQFYLQPQYAFPLVPPPQQYPHQQGTFLPQFQFGTNPYLVSPNATCGQDLLNPVAADRTSLITNYLSNMQHYKTSQNMPTTISTEGKEHIIPSHKHNVTPTRSTEMDRRNLSLERSKNPTTERMMKLENQFKIEPNIQNHANTVTYLDEVQKCNGDPNVLSDITLDKTNCGQHRASSLNYEVNNVHSTVLNRSPRLRLSGQEEFASQMVSTNCEKILNDGIDKFDIVEEVIKQLNRNELIQDVLKSIQNDCMRDQMIKKIVENVVDKVKSQSKMIYNDNFTPDICGQSNIEMRNQNQHIKTPFQEAMCQNTYEVRNAHLEADKANIFTDELRSIQSQIIQDQFYADNTIFNHKDYLSVSIEKADSHQESVTSSQNEYKTTADIGTQVDHVGIMSANNNNSIDEMLLEGNTLIQNPRSILKSAECGQANSDSPKYNSVHQLQQIVDQEEQTDELRIQYQPYSCSPPESARHGSENNSILKYLTPVRYINRHILEKAKEIPTFTFLKKEDKLEVNKKSELHDETTKTAAASKTLNSNVNQDIHSLHSIQSNLGVMRQDEPLTSSSQLAQLNETLYSSSSHSSGTGPSNTSQHMHTYAPLDTTRSKLCGHGTRMLFHKPNLDGNPIPDSNGYKTAQEDDNYPGTESFKQSATYSILAPATTQLCASKTIRNTTEAVPAASMYWPISPKQCVTRQGICPTPTWYAIPNPNLTSSGQFREQSTPMRPLAAETSPKIKTQHNGLSTDSVESPGRFPEYGVPSLSLECAVSGQKREIPLTGDPEIDEEIIDFYRSKENAIPKIPAQYLPNNFVS